VAATVKWQFKFDTTSYDVPETAKVSWANWTSRQKDDLYNAYTDAWKWYIQPNHFQNLNETITYPPNNIGESVTNDNASPYVKVDAAYAWDLYIRWIALICFKKSAGISLGP
jgi:hypothetical protein